MKKLLYVGNIGKAQSYSFYRTAVSAAHESGIEFHIAFNCTDRDEQKCRQMESDLNIHFHQIDFQRNPLHPRNIRAYRQLTALIKAYDFYIVHCNTPVGGLFGRIAARKCGIKKVIYQAHGFHFYKGAPLTNWLLYYPVEKWLAHCTDSLITINKEDYELARTKMRLRNNGEVFYVPGVGIDLSQYDNLTSDTASIRKRLNVSADAFVLVSAGELNGNKNNKIVLEAMKKLDDKVHYILCGIGPEENSLREQARALGISERVHFLGYRNDMKEILKASDVFIQMSFREGLSRSIMEAMACGLPCVVSDIRGNRDLFGYSADCSQCISIDEEQIYRTVSKLMYNRDILKNHGAANKIAVNSFSCESVVKNLSAIYSENLQSM